MSRADVWVLIVNWNGARDLPGCLDALRGAGEASRIVVVDNGSTDASHAVVAARPGVEWLPVGHNSGFAAANNAGMERALEAGARWVALVNPDVVVEPGWLDRLVEAGEARPRAGMLGGVLVFADRPGLVNSTGLVLDPIGRAKDRDFGTPLAALDREDGPVEGLTGGAVLLRGGMLREVGLFDPDYFAYYEDLELSLRARRAGWTCEFVGAARARHGYGHSFGAMSERKKYLLARNHLKVLGATAPRWKATLLVPSLALARVLSMPALELVRGRPGMAQAHLRGAVDGLAAGFSALRARGGRKATGR